LASPDCGAFPVSAIYEIALVVSIHPSAREATAYLNPSAASPTFLVNELKNVPEFAYLAP
jgi:hypothetical protein